MAKTNVNFSIDTFVFEEFKRIAGLGGMSKEIEKFMRFSSGRDGKLEKIDKALLTIKKDELINKITKLITERDAITKQLDIIDNKNKEKEVKVLEEKKEIEEKSRNCFGCGKIIGELDKPVIRNGENFHNYFCFEEFNQKHQKE